MTISSKLEQLRNKSEREKHFISIVGSIVFTSIIVLFWGYTFVDTLSDNREIAKEVAKDKEYSKQFSPLASLKNLIDDSIQKIKIEGKDIKNSASVIFNDDSIAN